MQQKPSSSHDLVIVLSISWVTSRWLLMNATSLQQSYRHLILFLRILCSPEKKKDIIKSLTENTSQTETTACNELLPLKESLVLKT